MTEAHTISIGRAVRVGSESKINPRVGVLLRTSVVRRSRRLSSPLALTSRHRSTAQSTPTIPTGRSHPEAIEQTGDSGMGSAATTVPSSLQDNKSGRASTIEHPAAEHRCESA